MRARFQPMSPIQTCPPVEQGSCQRREPRGVPRSARNRRQTRGRGSRDPLHPEEAVSGSGAAVPPPKPVIRVQNRGLASSASVLCRAASGGGGLALAALLLAACAGPPLPAPSPRVARHPAPSPDERYCAWYADPRDGVLYFGMSAFWWALREAGGDATGDLAREGPIPVGRFDLETERFLDRVEAGEPGERSGVWDVHAHENGRVYFTTYFEPAGWVEPSGEVRRLPELGAGLNEIAPGPGGSLLFSRYGYPADGPRGVAVVEPDGTLRAEYPLAGPPGYAVAPKTVAWDPVRREIWVTTDGLPAPGRDAPIRHDTYVLDEAGREKRRIERPEVQFVAFDAEGRGYRAESDGGELWLVRVAPDPDAPEQRVLLDDAFPAALDFAQDIKLFADGRAVVSRWSGWLHVVEPGGEVRALRLQPLEPGGLFYTAALRGDRVCVTHCADVAVVCEDVR